MGKTPSILQPVLLTLFLFVALAFPARSQAPDFLWAKNIGSYETESYSMAIDVIGNAYILGNFAGTLTLGATTLKSNGSGPNVFIIKYDPMGKVLWAKQTKGQYDYSHGIAVDGIGNVYIIGHFVGPQTYLDPITLTNSGQWEYSDVFIAKYDSSGNILWAKSGNGHEYSHEVGNGIAIDSSGDIYFTGYFTGSYFTFDTLTLNDVGQYDIFVVKCNSSGNVLWAKSTGGNGKNISNSIAVDKDKNVYVTGYFESPSIFFGATTLTNAGLANIFIVKYDSSGNIIWANRAGGSGMDVGNSIVVDKDMNIYITGEFLSSSITFNTNTLTNAGGGDFFIAKYDPSGNVLWAKGGGGNNSEIGNSISIDRKGYTYITGYFTSSYINFNSFTLNNNGMGDIFIAKYDSLGNVLWAKSAGGRDWDFCNSTGVDGRGNIYLTGYSYSPVISFGSINLTNTGQTNAFIAKLSNHKISGLVFNDLNINCIRDANEFGLVQGLTLMVNPGNIVVQTGKDGTWYIDSLPAGNYTLTSHTNGEWKLTCPETQNFTVTDPNGFTVAPVFGFVSTEPCPQPDMSVNAPTLRRCFSNQNIYVNACNKITATGTLNNAYVVLELDSFLIPQSFSTPYTDLGNNTFRFDVGTLYPGICTKFSIACSLSCNAMMGQTLCMKANLFPTDSCIYDTVTNIPTGVSPCMLPWDKSSLKVEGSCVDDTIGFKAIRFVVYNTGKAGEGDMQCYSPVRIYVDALMFKLDSVKLNGGDSIVYAFAGDGKTWRLEADQHPKHPGHSHPNATIEACGETINWTPGLVNALPMDDADPVVDIYCGTVTTSYDPNDKAGYPAGIGENNNIMPNQKIEYVIRFQNTGNDTAVTVVVRDTLNMALDIFSVTSGASSHNYSFRMYGPRILEWIFDNILLLDSNVNEPASHGFVTFSVNQINGLANETKIKNTADIYFDFNAPVRTNTVVHTVQDDVQNIPVSSEKINLAINNTIKIYPNPAGGKLLVEIPVNNTESVTISIHDLVGKKLMQWKETVTLNYKKEIDLRSLPAGVYILKVQRGEGGIEIKKVVVY